MAFISFVGDVPVDVPVRDFSIFSDVGMDYDNVLEVVVEVLVVKKEVSVDNILTTMLIFTTDQKSSVCLAVEGRTVVFASYNKLFSRDVL